MNWNILQRWKIFHFWWKIFHFGEIIFSASRPSRLPNCIPEGRCGNFSTLLENFPLRKIKKKKKKIIPKSHELEHSAEVEKFPLWWIFFFGIWTFSFAKLHPRRKMWKFFHFGGKFSTSKNFQKKKILFQNHMNWNILQRWKFFHFWWKIFHFGEILFSGSGPSRLPNLSPKMQSGKFSTLVENFPLSKSCKKKKFFIPNSHELGHSA